MASLAASPPAKQPLNLVPAANAAASTCVCRRLAWTYQLPTETTIEPSPIKDVRTTAKRTSIAPRSSRARSFHGGGVGPPSRPPPPISNAALLFPCNRPPQDVPVGTAHCAANSPRREAPLRK